ncbi:MAG: hypothetical protein ABFD77_10195 [Thermotogota bacterium]
MNERDALKEIADIKAAVQGTATRVGRHAGWFFLAAAVIWTAGFVTTQWLGNDSRFVWIGLNVIGIGVCALLARRFFGKRGEQIVPAVGRRMGLWFVGATIFDVMLGLLLGLTAPEDITLLIALTAGLSFFVAGSVGSYKAQLLGVFLWCATLVGRLAVPSYLPLVVALSGGVAFLAVGISFLLRREA